MISLKKLLKEGSDWVFIKSAGKDIVIDSYSGSIFNFKNLGGELEAYSPAWMKIYKKLSNADKKTVDNIMKDRRG